MPDVVTSLQYLTPDTQKVVGTLLQDLANDGYTVSVLETYRPQAREDAIRSAILAGTKKGIPTVHSWHTVGRALDLAVSPHDVYSLLYYLDLARSRGFSTVPNPDTIRADISTGRTPNTFDYGHLSYRAGLDYASALAQYKEYLATIESPGPSNESGLAPLLAIGLILSLVFYHAART